MALDWIGALMESIGSTITAGANVNLGQMNERNTKLNAKVQEDTNRTLEEIEKIKLANQIVTENSKIKMTIIIAMVVIFFLILYLKKQ